MKDEAEKRSGGTRAQVEIDVDLSTYGRYYLSKLENVSSGGAFVRTRSVHPVGTDVKLRFRLPDDTRVIEASAEVVWVYDQAGDVEPNSTGMGIRFTNITDEDQGRIANFVDSAKADS